LAGAARTLRRESLGAKIPGWAAFALLLVGAVIFSVPFLWTVSTALKTNDQVFAVPPVWIPAPVEWSNLQQAWTELPFTRFVGNTVLVTLLALIGADAYLLKSVIHDWNDERSTAILQICHEAMAREARLLLVERIMPERMEALPLHQSVARSDLNMLVGPGGRERTEAEFEALLNSSGFRLTRILQTGPNSSVIEGVPA
jgi:hypothetical protein